MSTWGLTWGTTWGNTWGPTHVVGAPIIVYGADAWPRRRRRPEQKTVRKIIKEERIVVPLQLVQKLEPIVHLPLPEIQEVFKEVDPIMQGRLVRIVEIWRQQRRKTQEQILLFM